MGALKAMLFLLMIAPVLASTKPVFAYSRITAVNLYAPVQAYINQEIPLQADIYTGENVVEYTHNVSVYLILPPNVSLTTGVNPIYVGEMGPGPAYHRCTWTIEPEEPGEYLLTVNASCINTQYVPQWMDASATLKVYAPPHVEFEYTPTDAHANETVTFNATKSYPRGPDSSITMYTWDFGDGTNATTNETSIEHEFFKTGNFTVSLVVTDDKELYGVNATEITIRLFGDLDHDDNVNIMDIAIVARAFGGKPGQPGWNPIADLNNDGVVDILDISLVARQYGKTAQ